jgi:hypothetical protein
MVAAQPATPGDSRKKFTGAQLSAIVVAAVLLTVFGGWAFVRFYLLPQSLQSVSLSQQEQAGLDRKLALLGLAPAGQGTVPETADPQPYSEAGASRVVEFSERELNGLLARDPEWGSRVAIDLSDDLVSLTALVPVPEDFPIMPGRNVRLNAGAEFAFRDDRPMLVLKGVSVMGVPLPNAWLGNMKNVDLIQEFGNDPGFWKSFAAGVAAVDVREGSLTVELRE